MDRNGFFVGSATISSMNNALGTKAFGNLHKSSDSVNRPLGTSLFGSEDPDKMSFQASSKMWSTRYIHKDGDQSMEDVPTRDGYIAFGTIRLIESMPRRQDSATTEIMMIGTDLNTSYPGPVISNALKKGWIRINELVGANETTGSRLRVYVLPEDVDRGSRGSLRDFQKTVKWLLDYVDCSVDAWHGRGAKHVRPQTYQNSASSQEESLFYIFNTLQSPDPDLQTTSVSGYGYHVMSDILQDRIAGLKTQLYPYQRRSIAAMAQRESNPMKICDARKRAFKDMQGQDFYLDPFEGVLLKDPPLYTEPQGGILAETMGYGKTLICIALILATRGHYPKVPQDQIDHFRYEPRERVGSLLAMAARKTKHEGLPWKTEFGAPNINGFQFDNIVNELDKYERVYAEPIFTPTTPGRKGKRESYNVIRLCSATLVIVPTNLLLQWQQEIAKHVEHGMLDALVIDTPNTPIPPWQDLLKHDVVLITKARFEQEYKDDDLNQGRSRRGEARYRSPLTDVRWLRVICDEGHGFAGSSCRTNAMAMLDKMYIERRWVVSGTPSSTLHGVEVDLSTTTSSSMEVDEEYPATESAVPGRSQSISKALHKRRMPSAYAQEEKDLERLRLIVVNFLRLQPWANQRGSDNANWKKYLSPRISSGGQRFPSPSLREVLQTLIIRHRIDDIDCDLQLPALHTKIVYLDPSYHDKLAINMFGLVLASNFVTSEREDEDYMFHPKNRRKFDLLINNLRQATFHWVGFTAEHVKETLRISSEYLDKNIDKISDEDGLMLTEGILNGERALADPSWLAFSKLHEVGVYVEDFPQHARGAWALDGRDHEPTLLGTVQAREARKFVQDRFTRMSDDVVSGLAGAGLRAMKSAHDRAEDEQRQNSMAKLVSSEKEIIGAIDEPKLKASLSSISKSRATKRSSNKPKSMNGSLKRKHETLPGGFSNLSGSYQSPTAHTTLAQNKLPQSAVVGFTSAKLNYLVNQLLLHSQDSKSIIFYSHPNTAFFIAEALELLRISHRIYASTLSMAQRNAYLQLFNADESIRVLLMDLKQAGQGLHIASANRVYIVAPIWEDGVQSQAIKRAHRIGQTRDVYVETLVLKGTFEEELIHRRQEIDQNPHQEEYDPMEIDLDTAPPLHLPSSSDTNNISNNSGSSKTPRVTQKQKSQSLLDDRRMVQVLKNIKFLKFSTEEEHNISARITEMHADRPSRMLFDRTPITTTTKTQLDTTKSSTTMDPRASGSLPQMYRQTKNISDRDSNIENAHKRGKVTIVG